MSRTLTGSKASTKQLFESSSHVAIDSQNKTRRGPIALTVQSPLLTLAVMEVHLKPGTESRLNELASKSGRPTDEIVEDAMAAYLTEVAELRATLDSRYDDLKSGRVQPLDGESFFEDIRRRENDLTKLRSPK